MKFKRIAIIGVGLIGGSIACALRKANAVETLVGIGRNQENLQRAKELGVIDEYTVDIAEGVANAELVILAVPLGTMSAVIKLLAGCLSQQTILTDVGSAKASVINDVEQAFGRLPENFVPGHPIAGTEKSGVEAAFAELFERRRVILTPTNTSSEQAIATITAMWKACSAEVIQMDIQHHDQVLAATSHLPHMLAYALVDTLARMDDKQEIFDYAAGGFRDFTRIASSDPQMWHDICLSNQSALLDVLERFSADLQQLTDAIRKGDSGYLKSTFMRAKQARDAFCEYKDVTNLSPE